MGPTPTPPPAERPGPDLEPARARLLRLLAGAGSTGARTVNDLTATVGGHPNTVRHHLRALVAAGLVEEQRAAAVQGRGRPATRYVATRAGRDAVAPADGGAAAREYVALAAAFAERLAERDGDPGADARAIGRAWGAGLVAHDAADQHDTNGQPGTNGRPDADDHHDRCDHHGAEEQVVGLLDRLGFSPAPEHPEHREPGDGATVLLRTCPLLDAARRHPEVVCEVHLGLVTGALEALDAPSQGVRLAPFARPGACVLGLPATLVG